MALIDYIDIRPIVLDEIIQHRHDWKVPTESPAFLEKYYCYDNYGYDNIVGDIRYTAVIYNANHLTFKKVPNGNDMISFGFNGCSMVTFTRKDTGKRYVGHIPLNKKLEWELFRVTNEDRIIENIQEFNPMRLLGYTSYPSASKEPCTQIWGLIMHDGKQNVLEIYENWVTGFDSNGMVHTQKGESRLRRII